MAFGAMAIRNRARRRATQPPKLLLSSSQYITDEMLAPYVPSFLPTSQVELTISCQDLLSTHTIRNKSDPYCVVSMKRPWQDKYKEIARTETIENTHNPQWMEKIILDYNFETIQNIKFEIHDKDLKAGDFLGRYETTLSELVASSGCQSIGKLIGKVDGVHRDYGEIIIVTEEVISCKQIAKIQFFAQNLPKLSWLRSNDPFLVILRSNEDASYSVVTSTEPVRSTQNPTWKTFTIRATNLCNGDFDREIKIDCYNYRDHGKHKLIGTCYSSLHNLKTICENDESKELVNEEKQETKQSSCPSGGVLKVAKIEITEEITFLDYIRNGTQMHFAVAIDFTASNGIHTDPKSLHFLSDDRMNSYEIALQGIGDIIQQYDNSQLFPAFGKVNISLLNEKFIQSLHNHT